MTATTPVSEKPWYRYGLLILAVGSFVAFAYFTATYRGWLPGDSGKLSSLLLLGANTAFLWGLAVLRSASALALVAQGAGFVLLVLSIAALGRGS